MLLKQNNIDNSNPAVILGMYETGLSVGRSIGRKGINVFGLDHKIDTGFYSKYITAFLCPHPLFEEKLFIEFLIDFSKQFEIPPVLFIAADEFLEAFYNNRELINEYYLNNIPENNILRLAFHKYELAEKAKQNDIPIPDTYYFSGNTRLHDIISKLDFPFIIKADNVNEWRYKINSNTKTYLIRSSQDLLDILDKLNNSGIGWLAQELIPGNDNCHYKYCAYYHKRNSFDNIFFLLKKNRQYPPRFGIGCNVTSIKNNDLLETGLRFFKGIHYNGIGSCEFKLDERDHRFKLIELNARYWQQYSLAERCGVNMAYFDYMDSTGREYEFKKDYESGIKWINIHLDFISYLIYKKEKMLSLNDWLESLKGEKIFSDLSSDDILPFLYEIKFGKRLLNIKRVFNL